MLTHGFFQLTVVHSEFIRHQERKGIFLTGLNGDALLENEEL